MRDKEAFELLSGYAEKKEKVLLELTDGQKIYCYPKSFSEADLDDLGFNFKVSSESEGLEWMHGTKFFSAPFSMMSKITQAQ